MQALHSNGFLNFMIYHVSRKETSGARMLENFHRWLKITQVSKTLLNILLHSYIVNLSIWLA